MKKLLALVLALVMTLGLATVGANAAYKDADSINYKEAVDVMSAIGVLAGADGAFNPKGTLTREQGAKIITYMIMGGQTGGDALTASSAPFDDVAADRWSAGAISYCKNAGILGGVGGNKFDPEAPLTGYAFAKMLLTALGYNATKEGLVGGDWTLNVARLINKTDLANGLGGVQYSQPLTRDAAAKLSYNTLTQDMVEYPGALTVTTTDGTTVSNAGNATPVAGTAYSYITNGVAAQYTAGEGGGAFVTGTASAGVMQFCENYFPTLKISQETDDFGYTVNYWYQGNSRTDYTFDSGDSRYADKAITSDVADTVVATLYKTKDITYNDLYKLGKWDDSSYIEIVENGNTQFTDSGATFHAVQWGCINDDDDDSYDGTHNVGAAGDWKNNTTKVYALTNYNGGSENYNGCKVDFVDANGNDGLIDTILVTYGYFAEVTKVVEKTSSKDRYVELKVYDAVGGAENYTGSNGFETEEFAKGDFVIVYPDADKATNLVAGTHKILDVQAAEKVSGVTTAVSGTTAAYTKLTVGGTVYEKGSSALAAAFDAVTLSGDKQTTVDAYLLNGYLVGVKVTAGAGSGDLGDVVWVVDTTNSGIDASTGETMHYVRVVKSDGTYEVVKTTTNPAAVTGAGWYVMGGSGKARTFTAPADGNGQKLTTDIDDIDNTTAYYATGDMTTKNLTPSTKSVTFSDDQASGATTAYLNEKTIYLFYKSGSSDTASAVVGGITRANADPDSVLVTMEDGTPVVAAMIFTNATYSASTSSDVLFIKSVDQAGSSGKYPYYSGLALDGSSLDVVMAEGASPDAVGFWKYSLDANGVYTLTSIDYADTDTTNGAYQYKFVNAATANITRYGSLLTIDDGVNEIEALETSEASFKSTVSGTEMKSVEDLVNVAAYASGWIYVVDGKAQAIVVTAESNDASAATVTFAYGTDTYTNNAGTTYTRVSTNSGLTIKAPNAPSVKTGYQFVGWLGTMGVAGLYQAGDSVTITSGTNSTLTAVYASDTVTATAATSGSGIAKTGAGFTITFSSDVHSYITKSAAQGTGTNVGTISETDVDETSNTEDETFQPRFTDSTSLASATTGDSFAFTLTVKYTDNDTKDFTFNYAY